MSIKDDTERYKGKNFLSVGEASEFSGIGRQTLRILADQNKIASYKMPSGHRKFDKSYLQKMCDASIPAIEETILEKQNFIYARVSSKKQYDDLERQIGFIRERPEYASFTLIQDIASGINFKRKGLETILDSCLQGTIGQVIVAHRDRLARFGFELIKELITKAGGTLKVIDDENHKSSEQELAEDLLSIIHVYSGRQMGKRKYKTGLKIETGQNTS